MRIYRMTLVIMMLLLATTEAQKKPSKCSKLESNPKTEIVKFNVLREYRFKHLIGTSTDKTNPSSTHKTERDCLIYLGLNQKFNTLEKVTSKNAKKRKHEVIIESKGKGKHEYRKVRTCPQHGSKNKKTGKKSGTWRYSGSQGKFVTNRVGAHVRIQRWKAVVPSGTAHFDDCRKEREVAAKEGCTSWETIGDFVIPTTKEPNSQAGRKLNKKVNENPWEQLDQRVAGILIKLKPKQVQKC